MYKLCVCPRENSMAIILVYNNFLRMIASRRKEKKTAEIDGLSLSVRESCPENLSPLMKRRKKATALLSPRRHDVIFFSRSFFFKHRGI